MSYKPDGQVHGLPKIYSGCSHLEWTACIMPLEAYWMKVKKAQASRCNSQGKHLQQSEWAGLAGTTDLMGPSMCDDPCVSFGRVSVLDLTFVINARKVTLHVTLQNVFGPTMELSWGNIWCCLIFPFETTWCCLREGFVSWDIHQVLSLGMPWANLELSWELAPVKWSTLF